MTTRWNLKKRYAIKIYEKDVILCKMISLLQFIHSFQLLAWNICQGMLSTLSDWLDLRLCIISVSQIHLPLLVPSCMCKRLCNTSKNVLKSRYCTFLFSRSLLHKIRVSGVLHKKWPKESVPKCWDRGKLVKWPKESVPKCKDRAKLVEQIIPLLNAFKLQDTFNDNP